MEIERNLLRGREERKEELWRWKKRKMNGKREKRFESKKVRDVWNCI